MRRFALAALLLALALPALADIRLDTPVRRYQQGAAPGGLDDRFSRSGHPLDGIPFGAIANLSSVTGFQWYSDEFLTWVGDDTGATACTGGWLTVGTNTEAVGVDTAATGYGELKIATSGTENDSAVIQLCGESFKYVVGKQFWFFARVYVADADDGEAFFGLAATGAATIDTAAEFLAQDDGIYFEKAEAATTFDFHARKNDTSAESTAVTSTLADSTYRIIGFKIESSGAIKVYDGTTWENLTQTATVAAGNASLPDDVELTLWFGVETGAADVDSMGVDWVVVAQER